MRNLNDESTKSSCTANVRFLSTKQIPFTGRFVTLPADEKGTSEGRTAATNQKVRSVFVIGTDKKIKLTINYPMTTGRNFHEVLRALDSLQLTSEYKISTPADWEYGEDVITSGSVTDAEAKEKYPNGWKAPKPYLRIVPQPPGKARTPAYEDATSRN